jgi:hypothetical protein
MDDLKQINASVFADDVLMAHLQIAFRAGASATRTLWHAIYDTSESSLQVSFYLRDEPGLEHPGQRRALRSAYYAFRLRDEGRSRERSHRARGERREGSSQRAGRTHVKLGVFVSSSWRTHCLLLWRAHGRGRKQRASPGDRDTFGQFHVCMSILDCDHFVRKTGNYVSAL